MRSARIGLLLVLFAASACTSSTAARPTVAARQSVHSAVPQTQERPVVERLRSLAEAIATRQRTPLASARAVRSTGAAAASKLTPGRDPLSTTPVWVVEVVMAREFQCATCKGRVMSRFYDEVYDGCTDDAPRQARSTSSEPAAAGPWLGG
ncbi:MAG: hypothetical protein LC789_17265 [Actinobacteria bacterium]|nr:hypothetical protein [Actinomycetota bacterium]